jgi:hypothetical protein
MRIESETCYKIELFFNNYKQAEQFVEFVKDKENIFNVKKEAMHVFFHCFNSEYAKKLVGEYEAEFIYNLVKKND